MIRLSWPPRELSPNARIHWGKKSRATKNYRAEAVIATQAAFGAAYRAPNETEIPVIITFHPPDSRGRDDDNIIASFKAARDGIAQAMRTDDKWFRPRYQFGEPVNGGCVMVAIGGAA